MSDVNPYAAPLTDAAYDAELVPPTSGGIWRQDNKLVIWKDAVLPDLCIRCNAPANGRRLIRKLYWHEPVVYLLLLLMFGCGLIGAIVYAVVAFAVRKKAVVAIGICDRHYTWRVYSIAAWWLITVACVALGWYGFRANSGSAVAIAVVVFLGNLFFAVAISRPVVPTRIDEHYVWMKKIHPDYLAQFPRLPD